MPKVALLVALALALIGCGGSGFGAPPHVRRFLAVGMLGGLSTICLIDSNGQIVRVLYSFPAGETATAISPAWDTGEIGFTSYDIGTFNQHVGKLSADYALRTDFAYPVTPFGGDAALSPDGQKIALLSDLNTPGGYSLRIGDAADAPADFSPPIWTYPGMPAWIDFSRSSAVCFDEANGSSTRTMLVDPANPTQFVVLRVGQTFDRTFRPGTTQWTWIEPTGSNYSICTGDYSNGASTTMTSAIIKGMPASPARPMAFPEDGVAYLLGVISPIGDQPYEGDLYVAWLNTGGVRKIPIHGLSQIMMLAYIPDGIMSSRLRSR